MLQILWCFYRLWSGKYKRPLTSQNFIGLWKEKRYRRNMRFLFAGHSAGLLSKNFVKQRLHENFRIPAPWLTKEIIFVCTVFLSFTLRMTCGRTLIHARSTLWIAPQSLRFTLWNSGYWMSAYKERWRQHAVKFKWHSFKRLSQYLKCSPPQNGSYSHEQNSTYSVFMHVCEAWQPLLSLQIYSNNQLQMV